MAENLPNIPSGAVPPKPAEPAKVQPKKETVRINLPPKPTATPAIKLPTPGAPAASAATAAAPAAPASAGAPTAAPATPKAPTASAAPRAVAPVAAPMAPAISGGQSVSMIDQLLAVVVAVVGVALLVSVFLISSTPAS